MTSPSCTEGAYDFASLIRPRMYGSSDSQWLRTSTSPSCGVPSGTSTIRKSASLTAPVGLLANSTWRFVGLTSDSLRYRLLRWRPVHRRTPQNGQDDDRRRQTPVR